VASVTVADGLPLGFSGSTTKVSLPADANVAPRFVSVAVTRVGDGYLNTMGIPLLRGRGFTVDDGAGAEMVTVISKPLADRLFPDADAAEALGKRLTFGAADAEDKTPQTLTIVGVSSDFPTASMSARREQLLRDLPAAFQLLKSKYGSNYPSMMSLITGPSRTGDIERILVLGAHGPKKLTVLLVP